MASHGSTRIASLDIMRGLAVMGIFSVNVVGLAMIETAYFFPPAYGFGSVADRVMWAANFLVVDGKLRALFSLLFGASTVLVCERALAAGLAPWRVHYPRMAVLLGFGLLHYYLLNWGDILANYALVGTIAFGVWRLPAERLLPLALICLVLHNVPGVLYARQVIVAEQVLAGKGATPEQRAEAEAWRQERYPSPAAIVEAKAAHHSPVSHARYMLGNDPGRPFRTLIGYGMETLGLMLLGMAAYRSGFLTGLWPRRRYWQVAVACIGASLLYFGGSAWAILRADFDPFTFVPYAQYLAGPLRPVAALGYAAAIILLVPATGLGERLAAVGRMAFSNYLGATAIATLLFMDTGLGLYGTVSRGGAWLFVPPVWLAMLLWSPWWLARYRQGPLEWLWRSLARGRWEPLRRSFSPPPTPLPGPPSA